MTAYDAAFVVAKRAAVDLATVDEKGRVAALPGGAPGVIAAVARRLRATYVASAMSDEEDAVASRFPDGLTVHSGVDEVLLRFVRHDPEARAMAQDVLFSDVLWAAMHHLWDLTAEPSFEDPAPWRAWESYDEDVAAAVADAAAGAERPLVLLHDYQVATAAGPLRERVPGARVLTFVHCAWGDSANWRVLPREPRRRVLERMLGADVVAFFCDRWCDGFLRCVADHVPDARVSGTEVLRAGHRTRVAAIPLGYLPGTEAHDTPLDPDLAAWSAGKRLVVHYGRTNPVKNAHRAVRAFVAAGDAVRAADAVLLLRMSPSHLHVPTNARYVAASEQAVREANAAFGTERVRLVVEESTAATFAAYRAASVVLVNVTTDGQNLAAFEAPVLNPRVHLVLSEGCGAAQWLRHRARTVNPYDIREQAEELTALLTMPREQWEAETAALSAAAREFTFERWVREQVAALEG